MQKLKKLTALLMALVLMTAIAIIPSSAAGKTLKGSMYPTVFVHGMMGWGETDDGLANIVDYWGLGSGSMMTHLKNQGYNVKEAAVGPLSSNWDRACELYAQLMGTRVDYGAYHAKKYGHDRFGRDYTGKALLGSYKWSSAKKVNLVGHSMGGTTIRYLEDLLKDGDALEVNYSKQHGLSCSNLFKGGKGDMIYSITCISTPSNGTTYKEAMPLLYDGSVDVYVLWAKYLFSNQLTNKILDFDLDQFGVCEKPGEIALTAMLRILTQTDFLKHNDSCINDLGIDKACAINKRVDQASNVFYFSYPTSCVTKTAGVWIPDLTAFPLLQAFALDMANFTGSTEGYYNDGYGSYAHKVAVKKQTLGTQWQENDGFTNVYGDAVPFRMTASGSKSFDRSQKLKTAMSGFKPGCWYVYPTMKMDHFGSVGGVFTENQNEIKTFYTNVMRRINACTRTA